MKKYTFVSYKAIYDELEKFYQYGQELTVDEPDNNSEVWQVAQNMIDILEQIRYRAMRLEKEYNKKNI